jgi:hypothetical protein
MNHHPELPCSANGRSDGSIKDLRTCLGGFVIPAKNRLLRQVLAQKTKDDLIDALLGINHLPDLFDYFKDDIEHYTNGGPPC